MSRRLELQAQVSRHPRRRAQNLRQHPEMVRIALLDEGACQGRCLLQHGRHEAEGAQSTIIHFVHSTDAEHARSSSGTPNLARLGARRVQARRAALGVAHELMQRPAVEEARALLRELALGVGDAAQEALALRGQLQLVEALHLSPRHHGIKAQLSERGPELVSAQIRCHITSTVTSQRTMTS